MGLCRPCGQCIGCRLDYARAKSVRCMHELEYHDSASFLTITYDDKHLPINSQGYPTLVKTDLQKFFKRLRKSLPGKNLRYMASGEYGDQTHRPHYHVILFGYDFCFDRTLWRSAATGNLYNSGHLAAVWPAGQSVIADVTFDSANYVAGYTVKKLTGVLAVEQYDDLGRQRPFGLMSSRPAIGRRWIESNIDEVMQFDSVIVNGHEQRPPRYYDEIVKKMHPDEWSDVLRARREQQAARPKSDLIARAVRLQNKKMQKYENII